MTTIPDQHERQRALDKTQSFIVQAPAGSGKTELLTQRFLILLTTVKQPEEIVAITFTKKSAGEMRDRIIHTLMNAMTHPEPEQAHAKNTWQLAKQVLRHSEKLQWNLLENPNQLRIQTIDSFNAFITKQLPILSHFGAPPTISDNSYRLYKEATQDFLSHLEENVAWADAIAQLLKHLDNDLNKVQTLLISMLAKRDQWLPYITRNTQQMDLRTALENNLKSVTNDILATLGAIFPQQYQEELLSLLRFAAYHLKKDNSSSPIAACLNLITLPQCQADEKIYWSGISELLFTKEFSWRKSINKNVGFPAPSSANNAEEKAQFTSYKERLLILIDALSQYDELKIAFENLSLAPSCDYEENQWETLEALHQVLSVAVAQLILVFQQHGEIDYIENAQAALAALGPDDAPTDLSLILDYQIKHFLIDEFQDTSQSQFRLIEKLIAGWENNDGRTLFLVGDPMQSIYRFREAEVGLFIRAKKNGIGNIKLIPLTLSVNFRSVSGIVSWVNDHFQKVFPPFENIAMGAVRFSPSVANSTIIDQQNVFLHPVYHAQPCSSQADTVLQLIHDIKNTSPNENIAILVRSRSHLVDIITALKHAQISYRAIDIDPLDTKPVIQDLMALTRALNNPADRIAWLALLRAPWCGLTLNDLFILANNHPHACLWERLQSHKIILSLSQDAQGRLARILPILTAAIADRQRYNLRYWLENCWLLLGGPACVPQPSDLADAEAYFSLIEKLDKNGDSSQLNDLAEHVNKLFASPNNLADDTLQIMTIHNSKGLEFDNVILPHLERKSPNDSHQLLLWMEQPQQNDSSALILAPIHAVGEQSNSIYDYIKCQHSIKSDYESGRLLYVAATRAKKQLHLCFTLDKDQPPKTSLLEKLWNAIKHHYAVSHLPVNNVIEIATETVKKPNLIKRLTVDWQNPFALKPNDTISYQYKQSGFKLPYLTPKLVGIVIHQVLQYLCRFGLAWWQDKSQSTKALFLNKRFMQLGMQHADIEKSIKQTMNAIENTLTDPKGLWIIHSHVDAASELRITTSHQQATQALIIDRTFVENNIRWIIDFKTSMPETEDINRFIIEEENKYAKQLQQYTEGMRLMDKRPIKMGLYFPLLPVWREVSSTSLIVECGVE